MTTSPLLAGLVAASRPGGHVALAERLSGLITNKLCQCRGEAAGEQPSTLGRQMVRLAAVGLK